MGESGVNSIYVINSGYCCDNDTHNTFFCYQKKKFNLAADSNGFGEGPF